MMGSGWRLSRIENATNADERQQRQAEPECDAEALRGQREGQQQRTHPGNEQGGAEGVEAACRAVPGRGGEEAR